MDNIIILNDKDIDIHPFISKLKTELRFLYAYNDIAQKELIFLDIERLGVKCTESILNLKSPPNNLYINNFGLSFDCVNRNIMDSLNTRFPHFWVTNYIRKDSLNVIHSLPEPIQKYLLDHYMSFVYRKDTSLILLSKDITKYSNYCDNIHTFYDISECEDISYIEVVEDILGIVKQKIYENRNNRN